MGGGTALLALLGGVWFPIGSGVMHDVAQALPTYWLVQASRVAIGGESWGARGWLVIAAWSVVLGRSQRAPTVATPTVTNTKEPRGPKRARSGLRRSVGRKDRARSRHLAVDEP